MSSFEQEIDSIKRELGFNFFNNFMKPLMALEITGTFVNGVKQDDLNVARKKADKLKTQTQIITTKKLLDKQPMEFYELEPYLNMVNPHYFHVLDYVLWNTMTGKKELTMKQKLFMREWKSYQQQRLSFK
jgi:hypothetical protein